MKVIFIPSRLSGTIAAPPSKSMAHRMLICGGLSPGKISTINGISDSEDVTATLRCLEALGASYEKNDSIVTIKGTDIRKSMPKTALRCNESGSTLRFFLPLCLLSGNVASLVGTKKLFSRPLSVYETICKEQNLLYQQMENGVFVKGKISAGEYKIPGNISSQFITGLLFALPLCENDSMIRIIPPIESRSYLDLTIEALTAFGIEIIWSDDKTLFIKGNQTYSPADVSVEGDYSNTAFFAALSAFGHNVNITGLSENSHQGDKAYIQFFELLSKGTPTIHIGNCPDLGPVLMAVAAAKHGAVFTGTKRLKIKESDRGAAMAEELAKFGVAVTVREDSIVVYPIQFHAPTEMLYGHNDHRIVMALSTLLCFTGGEIEGAEAVKKSLPEYFDLMRSLGADFTVCNQEGGEK
ncbi:MAG: 3-phosphoshikimate 1-carboxyvinyltransferase [Clostridia bacterium]|nr:3-phosphoshikimate 1-carboxyvinyltransferase [Clostridia bacterium]